MSARILASVKNRSRASLSEAFFRILSARVTSRPSCHTLKTEAIPPSPMSSTILLGPTRSFILGMRA